MPLLAPSSGDFGGTPMRLRMNLGAVLAVALLTAGITMGLLFGLPELIPALAAPPHDPVTWPEATTERVVARPADPVQQFTVVAVGDLMAHMPQVEAARAGDGYDFTGCFAPVAPYITAADLAVGNLETVLAGSSRGFSGYPSFNSPDAYAEAAIGAGFDVLTTANNHCLDRGPAGITTTLDTLDRVGVLHTGTFRTNDEAQQLLLTEVRGVKVAVIAYTYGMNGLSAPQDKRWMVNVIDKAAMTSRVSAARRQGADLVIVSIHNGVEYQRQPSASQKALELAMIEAGADVVLGSHPHVVQPMETVPVPRPDGTSRTAFIIHSLGNFLSAQDERYRDTGLMLQLTFEKNLHTGLTTLLGVAYVPVWVDETAEGGKAAYRVLPIAEVLANPAYPGVTEPERQQMRQALDDTTAHLGSVGASAEVPGELVFYEASR